jgi:hypothetical protein
MCAMQLGWLAAQVRLHPTLRPGQQVLTVLRTSTQRGFGCSCCSASSGGPSFCAREYIRRLPQRVQRCGAGGACDAVGLA